MVQSKQGYIDIKEAKIEQLKGQQKAAIDTLAAQRTELKRLQSQHAALEGKEDLLIQRKETIMMDFEKLSEGTQEYSQAVSAYDRTERELAQVKSQQAFLEEELTALQQEIEQVAPYIAEIADRIQKTNMEKQLGALRHDVAHLREERASRMSHLSLSAETSVDALEQEADKYLEEKVERGKVVEEYAGATSPAVDKYDRKARERSAAERLKVELAARRAAKEAVPPSATMPETLTKRS